MKITLLVLCAFSVNVLADNHLHVALDNLLANMKLNDPELHDIYTTDDRAHEFEEKRSVHEIAKEKLLADLKVSTPTLHKVYMSLPADQQDAFLGDLLNGIGQALKGPASIVTGAAGLVGGAVHGAVKGVVDIGGHIVKGATEGCKSGILGCVGGAIGGTVKGAGNAVVSTLGGAHKGSEAGLNFFDKKHPETPKCAADTTAKCGGYAAKGLCTVNEKWKNYMRTACPTSCCGQIDCHTKSGPKKNQKCVFPYSKNGKTCHGPTCCNLDNDSDGPWCSTKTNSDGEHITGNYGYCEGACAKAPAPCKDETNCAVYKPYCNDPKYVASMKHNCKKTCNFC